MLPFRLFTVSLLFRMSSKVSDACTKAAGAVYSRALVQGAYAVLVLAGAFVGQHWGLGGVAIAVSITMGINWLAMAALSRSVTGLSWPRFARAQVPGIVLAGAVAGTTALAVHATRAAHLGAVPILAAASLVAAAVIVAALKSRSELFLGEHGVWASRHAEELFRRGRVRLARLRGSSAEDLAEANSK